MQASVSPKKPLQVRLEVRLAGAPCSDALLGTIRFLNMDGRVVSRPPQDRFVRRCKILIVSHGFVSSVERDPELRGLIENVIL